MSQSDLLQNLCLDFAERMYGLSKVLTEERKEFIMARQIFKSGTSIGANVFEAQGAQSNNDFIAKLHISLKESRETEFWLKLLKRTKNITDKEFDLLTSDLDKIIGLLIIIIKKTKDRDNGNS